MRAAQQAQAGRPQAGTRTPHSVPRLGRLPAGAGRDDLLAHAAVLADLHHLAGRVGLRQRILKVGIACGCLWMDERSEGPVQCAKGAGWTR